MKKYGIIILKKQKNFWKLKIRDQNIGVKISMKKNWVLG